VIAGEFAWMALLIGAAALVAALFARRTGNDKRDVRLLGGVGAALAGGAMVLMSLGAQA
jgi:hypothetical protein